uniref:Uncharacterized protein n=1 Tax=Parascaris univalens TaxID=6257 RepID=A0A915B8X2_PARUN
MLLNVPSILFHFYDLLAWLIKALFVIQEFRVSFDMECVELFEEKIALPLINTMKEFNLLRGGGCDCFCLQAVRKQFFIRYKRVGSSSSAALETLRFSEHANLRSAQFISYLTLLCALTDLRLCDCVTVKDIRWIHFVISFSFYSCVPLSSA